jgi:succinate-semialdehyde dehydrogenase/glutarate-semialdehyde dehydrogenase
MRLPDISSELFMYPKLGLFIDGKFLTGEGRHNQEVRNPFDNSIGWLPHATQSDLDAAIKAAERAFEAWRWSSPMTRSAVLRNVANLIREQSEQIAKALTMDQGKPLAEARAEVIGCAEHAEWHAEECRRIYGRVIPARHPNVKQTVIRQPVGVCAAFTPWNFPMNQSIKKIAAAIGAGCTMILKGPEDTPSSVVTLARIFQEAGLPDGCLNVVWGEPAQVSDYLIKSPVIRKVSFTGSVPVGKQLASLAGASMKRTTMELGGHSPVIVFDDADVSRAAAQLAAAKNRNAGQVCAAPSRFFVHASVYDEFVSEFSDAYVKQNIGNGLDEATTMGPLTHERRVDAMLEFVDDARAQGANVIFGGERMDGPGNFFAPTIIENVPDNALLMTDEPFGPIVPIVAFTDREDVIRKANSVPYGLASFVFTSSLANSQYAQERLETGMVNVNHFAGALPEIPFGGVKDSGFGSEGGVESFDGYLVTKYVSETYAPY